MLHNFQKKVSCWVYIVLTKECGYYFERRTSRRSQEVYTKYVLRQYTCILVLV
jgi:hypothetical protein